MSFNENIFGKSDMLILYREAAEAISSSLPKLTLENKYWTLANTSLFQVVKKNIKQAHQLLFIYFQVILNTRHTPWGLSGGGEIHEDILAFAMTSPAFSFPGRNCVLYFYRRHQIEMDFNS